MHAHAVLKTELNVIWLVTDFLLILQEVEASSSESESEEEAGSGTED